MAVLLSVVFLASLFGASLQVEIMTQDTVQYCSFFDNRAPTSQPGLKNCTWFKKSCCCLQQEIEATFETMKPLKGASVSCQKYINYLMCYICAPNQNTFYQGGYLTVCEDFCDVLYSACGSAVLEGAVIGELYPSGAEFCKSRRFTVNTTRCFFFDAKHDAWSSASTPSSSAVVIFTCFFLTLLLNPCEIRRSDSAVKGDPDKKKGFVSEPKHDCKKLSVLFIPKQCIAALSSSASSACFSTVTCLVSCVLLLHHTCWASTTVPVTNTLVRSWAANLSAELLNFYELHSQHSQLQQFYDEAPYLTLEVNGTEKVQKVKEKLEKYFEDKQLLAMTLAEGVQQAFDGFVLDGEQEMWKEEQLEGLEDLSLKYFMDSDLLHRLPENLFSYSSDYKSDVMGEHSTVKIPDDVSRSKETVVETVIWSQQLDSVFIENRERDHYLRSQYFGSASGVLRIFPGREWNRNFVGFHEDYDPRTRPWYQSAISNPKEIVIIIDASLSMQSFSRFDRAKKTAINLLRSLSTQDYVKVLISQSSYWDGCGDFVNKTFSALGCDAQHLMPVTDSHRKLLISRILRLQPAGASDHLDAFIEAYRLLGFPGDQDNGCHGVIAFITDGDEYEHNIQCSEGYFKYDHESRRRCVLGKACRHSFESIVQLCDLLQESSIHQINIFPFLVGESRNQDLLEALACRHHGSLSLITDNNDIIHQMEPYFSFFNHAVSAPLPVWSSPYVDKGGQGLMITVSVAVYSNVTQELLGVVGVDVPLDHVDKEIRHESWGTAYAFLVDVSDATAVLHPLSKQVDELLEEMVFVPLFELETHEGEPESFKLVIDAIEETLEGDVKLTKNAARVFSQESLSWQPTEYLHYFFARISGTNFAVVFNMAKSDELHQELDEPSEVNRSTSYLHTFQQYKENKDIFPEAWNHLKIVSNSTQYLDKDISLVQSAVFLSPNAFCDPALYLEDDIPNFVEIHHHINSPQQNSLSCTESSYKAGIKVHIEITSQIESLWLRESSELLEEVLWTYVGTPSGVMRIFPGVELSKEFTPSQRPWYIQAEANPALMAVSAPYTDTTLSEQPPIVTLSHTVHAPDLRSQPICKMRYSVTSNTSSVYVAETQMDLGCHCSHNYQCMSRLCYKGLCSQNSVIAVAALDMYHSTLRNLVYDIMNHMGAGPTCGMTYSCLDPDGKHHECEVKCVLVNEKAEIVVNGDDASGALLPERYGAVFSQLLLDGIFIKHVRTDYQAVCHVSQPTTPPHGQQVSSTSKRKHGPFTPFQNAFSCVKEVTSYSANIAKLADLFGNVKKGNLSHDPCSYGEYFFTVVPETDLFLLVLVDYIDLSGNAFSFNCHIRNSVLVPVAVEVDHVTCPYRGQHNITSPQRYRKCLSQSSYQQCSISMATRATPLLFYLLSLSLIPFYNFVIIA